MRTFTVFVIFALAVATASAGRRGRDRSGSDSSDSSDGSMSSMGSSSSSEELEMKFEEKFHTLVNDPEERKRRGHALREAIREIKENNNNPDRDFTEELNEYSNLPKDEFEAEREGANMPENPEESESRSMGAIMPPADHPDLEDRATTAQYWNYIDSIDESTLPKNFDGRSKGFISPVQNQGQCGSCVSFATTAIVETCLYRAAKRNQHVDLSEQYFVDCAYDGQAANGCNGAYPHAYAKHIGNNYGEQPSETKYTYLGQRVNCKAGAADLFHAGAQVVESHWHYDKTKGDTFMKKLVFEHGAVLSSLYASDRGFNNYKSGVFTGCTKTASNHAIVIVGWGVEDGKDYWLVKNSWGTGYGDKGFIKVQMGTCGIAESASVVVCMDYDSAASRTTPPPPTTCDLKAGSIYSQHTLTGTYNLETTVNGKKYFAKVNCNNSVCSRFDGQEGDACVYICGDSSC